MIFDRTTLNRKVKELGFNRSEYDIIYSINRDLRRRAE